MPITHADEIKQLVEKQLDIITDETVRNAINALMVEPFCQYRQWDYEPKQYPCWVVADDTESDTRYVYCEEGFGPNSPWGIVSASGLEMGMDSGWFRTFEDAFYDSFAAAPLEIWNVVKRGAVGKDREVTLSLNLTQAMELIAKLNVEQGNHPHSWATYAAEPRTKIRW
ncbi:MAG: hypothetical protein ABI700_28100 [Chloroflexota bacterium]